MAERMRWTGQIAVAASIVFIPAVLFGHAVVSPGESRPGAYERYVLRVPNESGSATTRVEITFPAAVRVISFVAVPGWQLEATMDSTGRAVKAVWTGMLPPERFVELPFMGVNPKQQTTLVWPVIQTYADGQVVQWAGEPGSNQPASVTQIGAEAADVTDRDPLALSLGASALTLSLLAIALTMRRRAI